MITCSKSFLIDVIDASCLITTSTPLPAGIVGSAYSQALTAVGTAPFTWSLFSGTLPPGITLSAAGLLSGTPTTSGDYMFTIKAVDATALACFKTFDLLINPTCFAGGQNSPSELIWSQSHIQGNAIDIFQNVDANGAEVIVAMWAAANPHGKCFEVCGTGDLSLTLQCTLCNPTGSAKTLTVTVAMSGAERVSPVTCGTGLTSPGLPNDCNTGRSANCRIGGVNPAETVFNVASNNQPGQTYDHTVIASGTIAAGQAKPLYVILHVNQMLMNATVSVSVNPP